MDVFIRPILTLQFSPLAPPTLKVISQLSTLTKIQNVEHHEYLNVGAVQRVNIVWKMPTLFFAVVSMGQFSLFRQLT
jgi:hypothetical protein